MPLKLIRYLNAGLLIFILANCLGCASVPKESVTLSSEIGKGIAESRRSHINLLNSYFTSKSDELDRWIEREYTPKFIANVQMRLKQAGKPETLAPDQLSDVLQAIIRERDQKHADLEKTRLMLYEKLDGHYNSLIQSNASITELLQSIVKINDAASSLSALVKSTSGGKVDIDVIDQKFSEYLGQAGGVAGKTTSLYELVKNTIDKKGE